MFTDASKAQLFPYLFNMINNTGNSIDASLSETTHYFSFQNGLKSALNHKDPISNDTVGVINIHHPIFKYDQECGPKGTQTIMDIMENWKNDAHIKGIVLDVNSGGGQASGNSEFAEYIHNYPKPVVTFTKDTIGSAAYYFASACNAIIAHKHADYIGCIGSMFYSVNIEGVLEKKGATINELYADLSPEKNKQSRALKKGNQRPLIEHILNPSAEQFHEDVQLYRPQISELALKGDIFSPSSALKEGLIDEIGTLNTAINKVFELASANDDNSNNNNSNKKTMSKLNVPLIEAVIGSQFSEGETENGIILSDDEALKVEQQLADNNQTLATANKSIETLEASAATLDLTIKNALETAGVENPESFSNEEGITQLASLVVKYGAQDGASTTQVGETTDPEGFEGVATQKLQSTINNL